MTIEETTYRKVWPLTNQSNNTLLVRNGPMGNPAETRRSEGKNKEGDRAVG